MSTGKLVWYHVAAHEWRDTPPKDGTWTMSHFIGRSAFSWYPQDTAIIDKLEAEREKLERELAAEREKAERYRLVTLRQDADNTALRELINEPYQFFRFGHKALFPWGKFLDRWCKRAEKLGFKKEAKP